MEYIIQQSRLALGYGSISAEDCNATAAAWEPHLEEIPDEQLKDVFMLGQSLHKDGPFGVPDMLAGWRKLKQLEGLELEGQRRKEEQQIRDLPSKVRDGINFKGCPPDIKEAIDEIFKIWEANLRKKPGQQLISAKKIKIPGSKPDPFECRLCGNSGWRTIEREDPFIKLPGSACHPCECHLGRKFDRAFIGESAV